MADPGDVVSEGNGEGAELGGGPDAGVQEKTRGVHCAGAEDGFFLCAEGEVGAGLEGNVDAGDGG